VTAVNIGHANMYPPRWSKPLVGIAVAPGTIITIVHPVYEMMVLGTTHADNVVLAGNNLHKSREEWYIGNGLL